MEIKLEDRVYCYITGKMGSVVQITEHFDHAKTYVAYGVDWDDSFRELNIQADAAIGYRHAYLDRERTAALEQEVQAVRSKFEFAMVKLNVADRNADSLYKQLAQATKLLGEIYKTHTVPFVEIACFLGKSIDRNDTADAAAYAFGGFAPMRGGIGANPPKPAQSPEQTAILSLQEEFDGWKKLVDNLSRAAAKEQQEINRRFEKLEAEAVINNTRYAKLEGRVNLLEYQAAIKDVLKPKADAG